MYKGQRKYTNQFVTIKIIFHKLYHENIIQCLDSFETNSEFCLVTELGTGQLYEIIQENKTLPEK